MYYALPGLRAGIWGLIGLTGVAAVVAGVVIHRPAYPAPWLLLATGLASFTAGSVVEQVMGSKLSFPSYADGLYLITYPLSAAGLLIFIRRRTPGRDRRSLIDAMTLTAGLALLSWIYLILPYANEQGQSWLQKSVTIAYPLGDVLLLAMIARLLAPGTARNRCVQLLTLGAVGELAADVSFGLLQVHGSFHLGTVVDLGWVFVYGAWGAAALHPTMTELTRPVTRRLVEVSAVRLTVLLLASLIAPVVLLVQAIQTREARDGVIAVFSAILFLLVLSRLWDVAASHRRALRRERAMRQAGLSLVSAMTVEQVGVAVKSATDALLGARLPDDVLFAVQTEGTFRTVIAAAACPRLMSPLGEQAGSWLPLLADPAPLLTPVAELGEPASEFVPGRDWMLLCPLVLEHRTSGDPLIGVIAVLGEERVLADLAATMEILVHQVALALERIMLRQEVIRQGNEAYFRTLVQDASDVILIVGDDGRIRYATPSAASIFGQVTVEGEYLWNVVADGKPEELLPVLARPPGELSFTRDMDREATRHDGRRIQLQIRTSDLRGDPTVAGLVLTIRDVTEQRLLEEQLKYLAFHDALTGLPNRLLFQDRVSYQLAVARRDGTTVGVLFLDLDDFKVVNDTMGHGIGDQMLAAVGARLSSLVRDSDIAARLGGDEFALLLCNVADSVSVEAAADRVVQAFSVPIPLASGTVLTTITVGIATTEDSADTDELLKHADLALYAAKAAGKRQWRRYQPVLGAGLIRRRELQAALEQAVTHSAFTLVYQPIVALADGEIAGFEALVRWPHPQWGMMQPDQFIALAEETGQIVPLGSWVLSRAVGELARWRQEPHPLYVSVNVSARQFSTPGFVASVRQTLEASGVDPGALVLELTESVLLCRDDRMLLDLNELRTLGVKLAIDDFGTGYSSFSYLRELPVDVLKMDKSFVDGIAVSEQRLALAEGIVQIAKTLRLTVVAEGIESEIQRNLLVAMGCEFGQGYLLAMPMPASQAETLTRTGSRLVPSLPRQESVSTGLSHLVLRDRRTVA
jgi:diguanylate cyclase (GGDEF)-like protein/PAS domain S-box-containing protein